MGVRRGSRWRPSLLLMTAGSALAAAVGNAVGLSAQPLEPLPLQSRLGAAIADDANTRDRAAARRGRTLDLREQAVRAAEARLKSDAAPPPDAAAQAAAGAPPPPSQYDDLAKIYAAMKPAAAAAVMEQLDLEVQMRVAQKMRERSIASVMAAMSPRGAAALTMALARKQAGGGAAATATRPRPGAPTPASAAGAGPPRDRRPS